MTPERREQLHLAKRRARVRARAKGLCIICTQNLVAPGRATCDACTDARVEARRTKRTA
jgi:hypothetical protein